MLINCRHHPEPHVLFVFFCLLVVRLKQQFAAYILLLMAILMHACQHLLHEAFPLQCFVWT